MTKRSPVPMTRENIAPGANAKQWRVIKRLAYGWTQQRIIDAGICTRNYAERTCEKWVEGGFASAEVEAYRCPGCGNVVSYSPCKICVTRKHTGRVA